MQALPIDIHANKLLDWLTSRRHCEKSWHEEVVPIRERINHAIQDMPEHPDIVRLLAGSHINYFNCLKVVDILKETDKDTKNLFGYYGSKRLKDWLELVKMYENKNVYLAEAAQMLVRNVNYEIPSLKKQIAKLEQLQLEYERKQQSCVKNAKSMRDQYDASCKQLGLPGKQLRAEIAQLLLDLPTVFADVAEKASELVPVWQYYSSFVSFICPGCDIAQLIPNLHYFIEHGDVTTYEWRYGQAPLRVEPPPPPVSLQDQESTEASAADDQPHQIDFGDDDVIDFGDDLTSAGDIDWGEIDSEDNGFVIPGAAELAAAGVSGITVEDSGVEGGVAYDCEALTLLDNAQTRDAIISELLELETFLAQRVCEMRDTREEGTVSISHMQNAPHAVQLQTWQSVSAMLETVRAVLSSLQTVKMQHLFLIKSSTRYVDRLVNSLQQKLTASNKMLSSVDDLEARKRSSSEEAIALRPKLQLTLNKTRQLQKQIEEAISGKYKGRPVNLMGGISAF